MEIVNYGYCCINLSLKKERIFTNRTCRKKTFEEKGLSHVSHLAKSNLQDLKRIIEWNIKNGVKVYRLSSNIFPWMSEYHIPHLPDFSNISLLLENIGNLIKDSGMRVSFHPGPFNVLGSPNEKSLQKTIKDLNQHGEILDLMNLNTDRFYPINIHCNGVYESKENSLDRWCKNYNKLNDSVKHRIVIENDDKPNMYSVYDLFNGIYNKIGIPITFDYHHHKFNSSGLSESEAFHLAYSTWQQRPLFHYSSSKKIYEDENVKPQAHSDFIYEKIETYNKNLDIDLECKGKDIALFEYLNKINYE